MNRIFVDKRRVTGPTISISEDDLWHMTKSLRMKDGEKFTICDGAGRDYECELRGSSAHILAVRRTETEPTTRITLFQGIPKESKMNDIVRMCTELGVARFVPIITEFGQVQTVSAQKLARWRKTAMEAAKQCNRGMIPEICEPIKFVDALAQRQDLIIIPHEKEKDARIVVPDEAVNIGVFIGSEGGFSSKEIEIAKSAGAVPVTLGKRILRTETAGVVVASIILDKKGE